MKTFFVLLMLCIPSVVFASSPQEIYRKLVKANGFMMAPKLIISESNEVQAENRGMVIVLYRGLIRSVRNDHELAIVLGHELAHGKLWHRGSTHKNEYAADKLGAKYAQKAGYNRCVGAKILLRFNRVATESHPAARDRYARIKCPS